MIISASYKTDIPAFYGEWFINRLKIGYCRIINPYNKNVHKISLKREDASGFVFWTKNLGPFMNKLGIVKQLGYPFIIQYTIHGYPRALESSVISADRSIKYIKYVAAEYGSRTIVWRYDPIIFSSITPKEFHIKNFKTIAERLDGFTDEVVLSFAQIYKKTLHNMNYASQLLGFTWNDPEDRIKLDLAEELSEIASLYNIKLTMCSQRQFLSSAISDARCIDANRLSDVAGYRIRGKLKGNRPDCGCYESIDIGDYDTCPHGCIYCYAVSNRKLAQRRYKEHDPNSEFLITPKFNFTASDDQDRDATRQTTLFNDD
ncbi:MAG: DUF1848 domain-containing protein [Methanothrix sp.]